MDATGRVYPAVLLRWLAQAAIDASAASGFDAAWYATAGTMWLVRRSTFTVTRPFRTGERGTIRTWVEDFRRVRSLRRYEVRDASDTVVAQALTDWVYVDALGGKPRRIPPEMGEGFGVDLDGQSEARSPWTAPAEPLDAVRTVVAVRWADMDGLAHVNNAAYLDLAVEGALDAFTRVGWPIERFVADGVVPRVTAGDLEYVDAARYRDAIVARTWTSTDGTSLAVHQALGSPSGERTYLRGTTTWNAAALSDDGLRPWPDACAPACVAPA